MSDEVRGRGWTMLCGDSTQIVSDFSDGLFDHLIADPPYTAHVHDRLTTNDGKGHAKRVRATFAAIGVAELAMVPDFLRVVKRWSLFFCALEQLGEYRQAAPDRWLRSGIYRKERATPQLSGDRPGNSCEGIAIFHAKGRKRWNRGGGHAFWEAMPQDRSETGHPTAKPLPLMLDLVDDFTERGELVLDTHAGSGTTGVACLRRGRRFVGIEKDPDYFRLCCDRLRAEEAGSTLMDARAGQTALFTGERSNGGNP